MDSDLDSMSREQLIREYGSCAVAFASTETDGSGTLLASPAGWKLLPERTDPSDSSRVARIHGGVRSISRFTGSTGICCSTYTGVVQGQRRLTLRSTGLAGRGHAGLRWPR